MISWLTKFCWKESVPIISLRKIKTKAMRGTEAVVSQSVSLLRVFFFFSFFRVFAGICWLRGPSQIIQQCELEWTQKQQHRAWELYQPLCVWVYTHSALSRSPFPSRSDNSRVGAQKTGAHNGTERNSSPKHKAQKVRDEGVEVWMSSDGRGGLGSRDRFTLGSNWYIRAMYIYIIGLQVSAWVLRSQVFTYKRAGRLELVFLLPR